MITMNTSMNSSNCDSEPRVEWISKCIESKSRSDLAFIRWMRLTELVSELEEEPEVSESDEDPCDPSSGLSASKLGGSSFGGDDAETGTAVGRGVGTPEAEAIASEGVTDDAWISGVAGTSGLGAGNGGRWSGGRF